MTIHNNLTMSLASIGLTQRRGCFVDDWLDATERWTDKEGTEDDGDVDEVGEEMTMRKTKMSSRTQWPWPPPAGWQTSIRLEVRL